MKTRSFGLAEIGGCTKLILTVEAGQKVAPAIAAVALLGEILLLLTEGTAVGGASSAALRVFRPTAEILALAAGIAF